MTKRLRQPLISFLTQTYMKIQYIREKNTFYSVLWQDDPTLLKERWGRGFGEANTWLTVSHCVFFRSAILLVNWQYHSHSEKRSHCQTDSFKMALHGVNCQIWLYFSSSLISSILTRSRTPLTEMQPPSHDSLHADDLNQISFSNHFLCDLA